MLFMLNSFHFVSEYFLMNKVSLNSLNSVAVFVPFTILDFLPSSESIECIFDFNPANLLIGIPFHFANDHFILTVIKL